MLKNMTIHKHRPFIFVLLALTVLTLSSCGGNNGAGSQATASNQASEETDAQNADTSASQGEKLLRMTQSGGYLLDPHLGMDSASFILYVNLYDSLVYPNMDGNITPGLAEAWNVSDDGLTWEFTLAQGVKFHDGSELKASDVVFSTNRMLALGQGVSYLFAPYVDTVEANGDYTVTFKLSQPFAPFLRILPRIYVVNEDEVLANKADGSFGEFGDYGQKYLAEHDAGSGAYLCQENRVQDRVVMQKFADYYGAAERNAPDTVEMIAGTETATVRTLMSGGQLEISDEWQTSEAYDALAKIDGVEVNGYSSGKLLYLMVNTAKEPTDDVHIRRALAYLIDYAQVITNLFPGFLPSDAPVPVALPGHAATTGYAYSLEKAKEELAQSKYADSLSSVALDVAWISEVPDEEKLALLIQANAQQVGLKVNVVKVPWASYVENVTHQESTPNAGVCFMSPDYDEAGSLLYQRYHSKTSGTWQQIEWLQDTDLDAEIDKALTTMDQDARFGLYKDLQQQVMDEVYGVSVAEEVERHAYYDYIVWPAMERAKQGQTVPTMLGYNYMFRTFQVNK
jgi:peptide/nickel transport system substrate-binding protein